jgi:hypothetical protein
MRARDPSLAFAAFAAIADDWGADFVLLAVVRALVNIHFVPFLMLMVLLGAHHYGESVGCKQTAWYSVVGERRSQLQPNRGRW